MCAPGIHDPLLALSPIFSPSPDSLDSCNLPMRLHGKSETQYAMATCLLPTFLLLLCNRHSETLSPISSSTKSNTEVVLELQRLLNFLLSFQTSGMILNKLKESWEYGNGGKEHGQGPAWCQAHYTTLGSEIFQSGLRGHCMPNAQMKSGHRVVQGTAEWEVKSRRELRTLSLAC